MGQERLGKIWVFDERGLEQALAAYESEALAAYPAREDRIKTTLAAMRDFLHSPHGERLLLGSSRDNH